MADTLSETQACDLLARMFRSRGYAVVRNVAFREYGVEFHADGWDPKARVGFEFLTSEDDDHDDLTLAEYQTLMAAAQRGELAMFVIDEVEPITKADLFVAAEEFLDAVEAARTAGRLSRARAGKAAKKVAKKAAKKITRKPAKKAARTPRPVAKPAKKARPAGRRKKAR